MAIRLSEKAMKRLGGKKPVASMKKARTPAPARRSNGEVALESQLQGLVSAEPAAGDRGWLVICEHRFAPPRRWRVDFYVRKLGLGKPPLAVEVEGGTYMRTKNRHTSATGFAADMEKYNELTLRGVSLIRVTTKQAMDGTAMQMIRRFFND